MKYDAYNKILTIDSIDQCNKQYLSSWIDLHIEEVLESKITRSYYTNRLELNIAIVCCGYIVAIYIISDGIPDEFIIQTLGYSKVLSSL